MKRLMLQGSAQTKFSLVLRGAIFLAIVGTAGCSDSEVGDVSLVVFTPNDIKLDGKYVTLTEVAVAVIE